MTDSVEIARGARRPRAPRRNSLGVATRERIILAAEELFAQRGILGPSLEEIGLAAGQRNKTVIQYHFGDRAGLVSAIVEYRSVVSQSRRAKMLAEIIAADREPDVRSLVAAIVIPVASMLGPGCHYMGFQAQLSLERGPLGHGGELTTIHEALRRLLPHLSSELLEVRWGIALDTHILTLAHIERQLERGTLAVPLDLRIADLIEVITGLLSAPVPSEPLALSREED